MKNTIKPPLKKPKIKVKKPNAKKLATGIFNRFGGVLVYIAVLLLLFLAVVWIFGGGDHSVTSYLWVLVVLGLLGAAHAWLLPRFFEWADEVLSWRPLVFTGVLALMWVGMLALSGRLAAVPSLAWPFAWAALAFLIPYIYSIAIDLLYAIPDKVFAGWVYPYGKEVPVVEVINPEKIKFYIAKDPNDDEYAEFALNVPAKYRLGDFMHYFIHRYNYDKNPQEPIMISETNQNENLYQWLFKRKPDSQRNKDVMNPNLTFTELGLKEGSTVVVERYFPALEHDMTEEDPTLAEDDLLISEDQTSNNTKEIENE